MSSSPDEVQFLQFLVDVTHATKVIEVGVFLGYTTLALAQKLPSDGKIVALDISTEFTSLGVTAWKEAKVDNKIDLKIGPAVDSLQKLLDRNEANTYDFMYIDADKENYDNYYELGLKLIKKGGIIAVDNTLWHGKVSDLEKYTDQETAAIHKLNKKIHSDPRVFHSLLPIADGLTLCKKN